MTVDGIRVNGQLLPNSAGRFRDHLQRPLDPWPYGTYRVEPGTMWVVSSFNSYSFDSRYYGAIPESSIRHHLRPNGLSLRKLLSGSVALPVVAATTGVIAWSGHLVTIPLSLVALLLVYRAKSRTHAYSMMFCYYAAASWPLVPGARAFFGRAGTPLIGVVLCLTAAALLGLPWGLLFTQKRGKAAVAVPLYVLIAAIPPLGVIGWASPLLSAGVLFPGSKWLGLALIIVFLSLFPFKLGLSGACLALCALVFQIPYMPPQIPRGWEAVNPNYGERREPAIRSDLFERRSMATAPARTTCAAINCACTSLRSPTCCCRCCGDWDWRNRSWPKPSAPVFGSNC